MMNSCITRCVSAAALVAAAAGVAVGAKYAQPTAPADVQAIEASSGNYAKVKSATKLYGTGGNFNAVTINVPVVLDQTDGFFNSAACASINGSPIGAVTTFDDVFFVAADNRPVGWTNDDEKATIIPSLGYANHWGMDLYNFLARITPTGNDVVIDESIESPVGFVPEGAVGPLSAYSTGHRDWSNGMGFLLSDGTALFRANFNSARRWTQTNVETTNVTAAPGAAVAAGSKFWNATNGIDDTPTSVSAFQSPPSGVRLNSGGLLLGQLVFTTSATNNTNMGIGVWQYAAAIVKQSWTAPTFRWNVMAYPLIADQNGKCPNPNTNGTNTEVRTSNIRMMKVTHAGCNTETSYVTWGEGSVTANAANPAQYQHLFSGGGFGPRVFFVDSVGGTAASPTFNGFTDGFAFIAADPAAVYTAGGPSGTGTIGPINSNYRFIEVQGTGNNTFAQHDINAAGQVVALWADFTDSLNPVYQIRRYDPIFDTVDPCKIVGYSAPVVIAQNATAANPLSYNGTSFVLANDSFLSGVCGGSPAQVLKTNLLQPFSAPAIDDSGNITFVGTVASFEQSVDFGSCAGVPFGSAPVTRNTTTTMCYYHAASGSLYRLFDGGQTGDVIASTNGGMDYMVGNMATDEGSDGYGAAGMSRAGGFLAVCARNGRDEANSDSNGDGFSQDGGVVRPGQPTEASARATLMVSVGAYTPPCTCTADVTGDCKVNTVDLGILLSHFGQSVPVGTLGDISGPGAGAPDGIVNTIDLGKLLSQFGCGT